MATYLYKVIRRVRRIAGHHYALVEVPERGVGVIASRGQDNRPLLVHRLVAGHWVAWVSLPVDPLVSAWRVERRGEFSPLGPLASCFLALGFGLGLVGTVSARR